MKQLLIGISLLWLPLLVIADEQQESAALVQQLESKREELDALSDRIIKLRKKYKYADEELNIFIEGFREKKKKELLSRNSTREITREELNSIYLEEVNKFVDLFFDVKSKSNQQFFNDSVMGKNTALFKFYIILCYCAYLKLEKLLSEFESLHDEIILLQDRLMVTN